MNVLTKVWFIWFVIFRYCIFRPCDLVRHIPVLHFPPPVTWSVIFWPCIFRAPFSTMPFCFPLTFKVVYTEKRCELAALMVCSELIRNAMSILFDTFTVMLFLYVSVTLVQ